MLLDDGADPAGCLEPHGFAKALHDISALTDRTRPKHLLT
jgi:hypothetical protein